MTALQRTLIERAGRGGRRTTAGWSLRRLLWWSGRDHPQPVSGAAAPTKLTSCPAGVGAPAGHLPALDGLRGAAMLFVLLHHAIAMPLKTAPLPVDQAARAIAYAGWTGLEAFFVLSGFLITGILLDTRGQPHWWLNFVARRALRVFPLYYGALALLFVVLPRLVRWADPEFITLQANQGWYWSYTVNLLVAFTQGTGAPLNTIHFWSLSIEEQFYLVWPLIVWACKPQTLLRVGAGAVLAGLALRLGLVLHGPPNPYALYSLTPCRLDGLMTGAALAVLARAPGGLSRLRAWVPHAMRVGGLALMSLALWRGGLDVKDPVVSVGAYPLVALVCGALLVSAVTAPPHSRFSRVLCSQWLRNWGTYSYGIYIVHLPLLGAIERKTDFYQHGVALLGGSRLPPVLLLAAVGISMSYVLGWLSYHLYEKRFLRLKGVFAGRGPGPAQDRDRPALGLTHPQPGTSERAVPSGRPAPCADAPARALTAMVPRDRASPPFGPREPGSSGSRPVATGRRHPP